MFEQSEKSRRLRWFPSQPATHDRWGEPLQPTFAAREFSPSREHPDTVLSRMRWSLGLM